MDTNYTFFPVPKAGLTPRLVQQYRSLRLKALETSPASFSSTYETEAAFTDEDWTSRILQGAKETFICAAGSPASGEWVGQLTLLGPLPREAYVLPEAAGQPTPGPDEAEERWQLLSLFSLPEHRGRGLGRGLVEEALRWLRANRPSDEIVVRLMVKLENTAAIKLYASMDWEDVGRCTLAEALIANGDEEMLPDGYENLEKYSARSGCIMIKRLVKA